jgi:hypothetical protein
VGHHQEIQYNRQWGRQSELGILRPTERDKKGRIRRNWRFNVINCCFELHDNLILSVITIRHVNDYNDSHHPSQSPHFPHRLSSFPCPSPP